MSRRAHPRLLLLILLASCTLVQAVSAETIQREGVRVHFEGSLSPKRLPRQGTRPITVTLGGRLVPTNRSQPAPLRRIEVALNRQGHLDFAGLPACRLEQIQPATSADALRACGRAKVGEGRFFASVADPSASPFPASGRLIAFNGREDGHPVLFAHVYGTEPLPASYTLSFSIHPSRGTFGTTLSAPMPRVPGNAGYITGIELTLHRTFSARGARRSYLSAGCPLPAGFSSGPFPLARITFDFMHLKLAKTLVRQCRAAG